MAEIRERGKRKREKTTPENIFKRPRTNDNPKKFIKKNHLKNDRPAGGQSWCN